MHMTKMDRLYLVYLLDRDTTGLELTTLLIHENVLAGGDSPESFPRGTEHVTYSAVIFEPSNSFSFETF